MKYLFRQNANPLISILSLLGVRYTYGHANKYFNEHPYKHSLYGLSQMLTYYGVRNMGIRISNKEDIHQLEPPFIAHTGNDFVTVESISQKDISYYWRTKKLIVPITDFWNLWTGTVLVAEKGEVSIEPDYKQHQKEELVNSSSKALLLLTGIILGGFGFYQNHIYENLGLIILLLLNLIGVCTGYLLVQKQIHIHSGIADKICSLFAQNDCNDVLNSPAAKFMGVIGWSELGFSYFISNIIIVIFASHFLPYLVLLNICALPYSFWSVWYQKFRAKSWCPLCLIVQGLFWLLFIIEFIFGFIQTPNFSIPAALALGMIYGVPFLVINQLLSNLVINRKLTKVVQQFNSFKANDKVFLSLLQEQTFYGIDKDVSSIMFGNPKAKNTITIFTNPHCNPCAKTHERIEKLLRDADNQYHVQYILSSFDDTLDSSCEFFIYVNKKYSEEERNRIYTGWFKEGKYNKEKFFKKYSFVAETNTVSEEFKRHMGWKKRTTLQATPTILFNGYELPELYFQQMEKLVFFSNIEIEFN